MTPHQARVVTACQQMLALAVVLAVLTPAASVVTLDVVGVGPDGAPSSGTVARPTARMAAYAAQAVKTSRVDTAPVRSKVREVQLTSPTAVSGRALPTTSQARVAATPTGLTKLTTRPQVVTGFGEVGVTWAHDAARIPETGIAFEARTSTHGVWTPWAKIPYDPGHAPDPHSAEGRHARPGTDPMLVGKVGHVQVRAITEKPLPADMRLAVIAPGHARHTASERAAYDTATMDGNTGQDSVYRTTDPQTATGSTDSAALAAAVFTPEPVIYSRAQWGADESIRGASSLHYGQVHSGFVHHTVNANDYTRAEVPGLLRSIYAYHVRSRGWSDIGYNYLIDRFGRIWEGRYGGIDRPVVGAHTLNYNDDSFAASAIGNYQITEPSRAMIEAYGTLFAWKLSLHGVDAASTHQWVTSRWFEAINGHRDAAATLCPGIYLFNKIPEIRALAAAAQQGWAGRELESNLASTPHPDLVVRRAGDGEGFVVPTGGLIHFRKPAPIAAGVSGATSVVVSPDLTGDGVADLLVQQADGAVTLSAGIAAGGFAAAGRVLKRLHGKGGISAPGDLNGDGRNDLVARNPKNGRLLVFLSRASGSFKRKALGKFWGSFNLITAAGDATGDGHPDLVTRDGAGKLWLYAGNGKHGFAHGVPIPGDFSSYAAITGGGDYTADGVSDLFLHGQNGKGYLLPGVGDGTFTKMLGPFGHFHGASGLAGGNVTGSSAPDLVAVSGDNVLVWVNPGRFDLGKPIDTGANFKSANVLLNAGDWDRDGYGDVITRTKGTGDLYAWAGDGRGHLGTPTLIGQGFVHVSKLAAVGDMTGDGYPDLMGQPKGGAMQIYPGAGMGPLGTGYPAYGSISGGRQIGVGRWNSDGAPDSLIRKGQSLTLYLGNGPGGLYGPAQLAIDLSPYDWVVGVSDLKLTGHPDLLVRAKGTGQLYELPGTDTGFGSPVYLGDGMAGYDLAD